MTNLQFITSAKASNSTSLAIANCFTTKYDFYKVILNNFDVSSGMDLALRFINSSDSVVNSSDYDDAVQLQRSYSGGFADNNDTNASELKSLGFYDPASGVGQNKGMGTVMYVFNPFSSDTYTQVIWSNAGISSIGTPARTGIGVLKQDTSITGLHYFDTSGGTINSLNISVYGVL